MLDFKPIEPVRQAGPTPVYNEGIAKAQEVNPDVVGWLTIPGTGVDYAFVRSNDNQDYLRSDLHGEYSLAGTIFLDHRNNPDFTDSVSILYGHNMKNGGMFGAILRYADSDFFQTHTSGTLYLLEESYAIQWFAFVQTDAQSWLYQDVFNGIAADEVIRRVREEELQYRSLPWEQEDRVLVLSTCTNNPQEGRYLLFGKLIVSTQT